MTLPSEFEDGNSLVMKQAADMGHTPGPWFMEEDAGEIIIVGHPQWPCERFGVKGEWGVARAFALDEDTPDGNGETLANALLIAAAPDLLEALRVAKDVIRIWHGPNAWDIYERSSPEMKKINAAIAKATGAK